LINNEFWGDIQVIVDKLPKQRRTGLFSATLSAAKVGDLIKMGLRNPVRVSVEV
jgi:superfamily II DNA/RNA helicase